MRSNHRWLAVLLAVAAGSGASALADRVYLVDGGSREGKVRVEGNRVIVEFESGSITLDRARVARIEYSDDPYTVLATRVQRLDARDARGHYLEGLWAAQHELPGPARDLFAAAVRIQPDLAEPNLALGQVWMNGAWSDSTTLKEQLRGWLVDGLNAAVDLAARQALGGLLSPADRRDFLELAASASRRMGCFSEALAYYEELARGLAPGDPQSSRFASAAELLREHPSGLYLVQVDEFAQAVAGAGSDEPARSGFYSLSEDAVLQCALRDRAKALIAQGEAVMSKARQAEVTDVPRSEGLYRQADDFFVRAEGLNPNIARSYRVEVRRRLIRVSQAGAEAVALRVDGLIRQLPGFVGKQPDGSMVVKSRQGYRNHLKLVLSLLDEIQRELDEVLVLAAPYQQELALVISMTQEDIITVKALRKTLEDELKLSETARALGP